MKKPPSQRQLKVGELLRSALSKLFLRGEIPAIDGISVTVSEVRISPDLKNATAYIFPLGGDQSGDIIKKLHNNDGLVRKYISREVELRYTPRIHFKLDNSFEEAEKISNLLQGNNLEEA